MNSTNKTFYPLDYWFSLYGYSYFGDIILAYAITPVWLASLILSIFSILVLLKAPFWGPKFFDYMRLYVANCLILSLMSLTTILAFTRRFFKVANTNEAAFYGCYVFFPAQNSLFLFSSCIEICLVVERNLYLLPARFRRIKLIGFNKFFFILFIICLLANVPSMFLFETAFADVQLDPNTPFRLWYFGVTSFLKSLTGQIFNYLGYILREILPMLLKIIVNSLSIYLVRSYIKKKQNIRATTTTTTADSYMVNFDRKQTYIALVMSSFSLLEHIIYITSYVLYFIVQSELSSIFYFIAVLIIGIKHLIIFFILLAFNNLFRSEVKNCF